MNSRKSSSQPQKVATNKFLTRHSSFPANRKEPEMLCMFFPSDSFIEHKNHLEDISFQLQVATFRFRALIEPIQIAMYSCVRDDGEISMEKNKDTIILLFIPAQIQKIDEKIWFIIENTQLIRLVGVKSQLI